MKRVFSFIIVLLVMTAATYAVNSFYSQPLPYAQARSASSIKSLNVFVKLSKKVVPSVVNISTLTKSQRLPRGRSGDAFRHFFEEFFRGQGRGMSPWGQPGGESEEGLPDRGGKPRLSSLGTGFIIDESGLILTNNHVVAKADVIKIHFTEDVDEEPLEGEVVGRDPELDLALIKVETDRKLVPVKLGDSNKLEVGEYVIAVGNPFGQGHSVTHGIISAKDRFAPGLLAKYLQTDAPINPGNSGGPLVNLKGEVIGINNAIEARAQGIGFAIPINLVKKVLPQLKTKGSVARGYIGALVAELTPEVAVHIGAPKKLKAPFLSQVNPGEPADKAGLQPYDVVLAFNGQKVKNANDLVRAVTEVEVGQSVEVKILRKGKDKKLNIIVSQRPTQKNLMAQKTKKPTPKQKPKVNAGVELEDLTDEIKRELGFEGESIKGVVVVGLSYDGPADRAGLMRGDVILEVDRKSIASEQEFYKVVNRKKSYLLRVRRPDASGGAYLVIVLDLS